MIEELLLNNRESRYFSSTKLGAASLVFLPGALQSLESLSFFHKALGADFNYFALELPGQGETSPLPSSYSFGYLADLLYEFTEIKGVSTFYLVVGSYSTAIALEFAKKYPSRLKAMVMVSSIKEIPEPIGREILSWLDLPDSDLARNFIELLADPDLGGQKGGAVIRAAKMAAAKYLSQHRASFEENTKRILKYAGGDIGGIMTPTHCITGELDAFTSPTLTASLSRALGNSVCTIIPKADHLMHIRQPKLTVRAICDFLLMQESNDPLRRSLNTLSSENRRSINAMIEVRLQVKEGPI